MAFELTEVRSTKSLQHTCMEIYQEYDRATLAFIDFKQAFINWTNWKYSRISIIETSHKSNFSISRVFREIFATRSYLTFFFLEFFSVINGDQEWGRKVKWKMTLRSWRLEIGRNRRKLLGRSRSTSAVAPLNDDDDDWLREVRLLLVYN